MRIYFFMKIISSLSIEPTESDFDLDFDSAPKKWISPYVTILFALIFLSVIDQMTIPETGKSDSKQDSGSNFLPVLMTFLLSGGQALLQKFQFPTPGAFAQGIDGPDVSNTGRESKRSVKSKKSKKGRRNGQNRKKKSVPPRIKMSNDHVKINQKSFPKPVLLNGEASCEVARIGDTEVHLLSGAHSSREFVNLYDDILDKFRRRELDPQDCLGIIEKSDILANVPSNYYDSEVVYIVRTLEELNVPVIAPFRTVLHWEGLSQYLETQNTAYRNFVLFFGIQSVSQSANIEGADHVFSFRLTPETTDFVYQRATVELGWPLTRSEFNTALQEGFAYRDVIRDYKNQVPGDDSLDFSNSIHLEWFNEMQSERFSQFKDLNNNLLLDLRRISEQAGRSSMELSIRNTEPQVIIGYVGSLHRDYFLETVDLASDAVNA